MTHRFWLAVLVLAVGLMPLSPMQAASAPSDDRTVRPPAAPSSRPQGGGTVTSCTEAELDNKLAGGGTVTFNCGGPRTILVTVVKTISQDTTLKGGDVITLTGGFSTRLFVVNNGVTFKLEHIVLDGASSSGSDGGAIVNHGRLYLDHSTIQRSQTDSGRSGGAIFSDGPVTITNSTLRDNTGGSAGALFANNGQATVTISNSTFGNNQATNGITGYGGAIWVGQQAQVSITGGSILSNTAQYGGGLYLTANGTLTLTSTGPAAILSGNSATASGGGIYNSGGRVTLTNATLRGNTAPGEGGGVYNNGGRVTLTNATFSGNSAGSGGGLANDQVSGVAILTHVTLSGNSAAFGGGGLYNNHGAATMANVVISGNVVTNTFGATYGGGIDNYGTLTLTNSTLSGNIATGTSLLSFGGGLYNNDYTSQDTATLVNSTLSGNSADAGGGIINVGTLTLTNSTLSANSATSTGGGIENYQGSALLTNDTLSGNSANTGGGLYQQGQAPTQTITVKNTIIASGLSGANCSEDSGSFGSLLSDGYNLSNEGTCTPYFNQPSDLNNKNPNLGLLGNNGGPTSTQLPNPPSKAIDAIPNGTNGCGTTLTTDQRGAPRPINGKCDIGAVEAGWKYPHLWLALVRR